MKNTNIKNLTNKELYISYQEAKVNFRNAIEGTQEELEADRVFTELSNEVESRQDFDWLTYKLEEVETKKQGNNMKSLNTLIKSIIITGAIAILTSIPAMAQNVNAKIVDSDQYMITAEYNNQSYIIERAESDVDTWNKGDNIILNLESKDVHDTLNGEYKAIVVASYPNENNLTVIKINENLYSFNADDNGVWKVNDIITVTMQDDEVIQAKPYIENYNVEIQAINYIDNTITIQKENNLYSFYDANINGYYIGEQINITMNQNDSIIECIVDNEPMMYNVTIDSITDDIATLNINGSKYTFENETGQDGWKTGDKCKVVIQYGKLLEVKPIPLNER